MADLEKTFKITDNNNEYTFKITAPKAMDWCRLLDCLNDENATQKTMIMMMNYIWLMAGDNKLEQFSFEKIDALFTDKKNILVFISEVKQYLNDFFQ